jgi:hypothetical protein
MPLRSVPGTRSSSFLRDCFPINILNAIKNIQEVCTIYCATANPAEVVIAESAKGRGIMGVIDGEKPPGAWKALKVLPGGRDCSGSSGISGGRFFAIISQ